MYPVPLLQDYSHCISVFFSKIDLVRAYHQIPVHAEDNQKTAITKPFSLFEFLFMSFDLLTLPKPSKFLWTRFSKTWISVLLTMTTSLSSDVLPKNMTNIFAPFSLNYKTTATR